MALTRHAKRTLDGKSTSKTNRSARSRKASQPKKASQSKQKSGGYASLLRKGGDRTLKIGVDFGTGKTCAAFIVTNDKKYDILECVKGIQGIHARNERIRFPTVMAILPSIEVHNHATILFGSDANQALHNGKITTDHVIPYPKLGLITDISHIHRADQEVLKSIQVRHQRALAVAKTYDRLIVKYPGKEKEEITLNTIDDITIACLTYFLGFLRTSICQTLQVTNQQLTKIFEDATQVAFAVPALWKDAMVEKFLCLIRAAGWPSYCRIWSEPECALAAHITYNLASASPEDRDALWGEMQKPTIVCDVGDGTTDLATLMPRKLGSKNISFESIADGQGSLCGGRLLDFNIEHRVRGLLGHQLAQVLRSVNAQLTIPISEAQFFACFDFDGSRQNFDASQEQYFVVHHGARFPPNGLKWMNATGIDLALSEMLVAHQEHASRVIQHIEQQIERTRKVVDSNAEKGINVVLVGGVTRAPFLDEVVKKHFENWADIDMKGSVENYHRPLVAIGCILSLNQPSIGKRFAVKEAYGIPVFQKYDPEKHSVENQADDKETGEGLEARDLMEWIVKVGDKPTRKIVEFNWTVTFYDDDDDTIFRTTDPRDDNSIYPLAVTQEIFSTTDKVLGSQQHVEYLKHPEIKKIATCEIRLSKEECLAITDAGSGFGFSTHSEYKCWSFIVPVRVILEWEDVRVKWRAEIPKTGQFYEAEEGDEEEEDVEDVVYKEIKFVTAQYHGHQSDAMDMD